MSFNISSLKYLEPVILKKWLDSSISPTGNGKFVVVDVRDSDYAGGHIINGLHYPFVNFDSCVSDLIRVVKEGNYNDVVFHCALSQQRGPSLAMRFMRELEGEGFSPDTFKVWILRGGFTKWQELYGEDASVTENYAKDIWQYN